MQGQDQLMVEIWIPKLETDAWKQLEENNHPRWRLGLGAFSAGSR